MFAGFVGIVALFHVGLVGLVWFVGWFHIGFPVLLSVLFPVAFPMIVPGPPCQNLLTANWFMFGSRPSCPGGGC
jgi:hypothetical protein